MFLNIEQSLWNEYKQAVHNMNLPLSVHQALNNLHQEIERRSNERDIPNSDKPSPKK